MANPLQTVETRLGHAPRRAVSLRAFGPASSRAGGRGDAPMPT